MIYLLRHGDAEPGDGDDAARRLTGKGERQAAAAGAALAALGTGVETCLCSPRVRARETARIAAQRLGLEVEVSEPLGGGPIDAPGLAAGRGATLLVGHEPDLSNEVSHLTGGRVKLRKGGLAIVDSGVLVALLTPRQLRAIAT